MQGFAKWYFVKKKKKKKLTSFMNLQVKQKVAVSGTIQQQ